MVQYTTSTNDGDLEGILILQEKNLPKNLRREEILNQGFVTVSHSLEDLRKMNSIEQSIIAKEDDAVIAYLLAMTQRSKFDIPVLIPMFEAFEKIKFRDNRLARYNYIVVGQACVDKNYRGQGVLDRCYAHYVEAFKEKYDFAVTEIATSNTRSINAHKRIGFKSIHEYIAPNNEEWSIVVLDWNSQEGERR